MERDLDGSRLSLTVSLLLRAAASPESLILLHALAFACLLRVAAPLLSLKLPRNSHAVVAACQEQFLILQHAERGR